MIIPSGFSQAEVCDTIISVAKRLASRYVFGYHDTSDIEQEAFIIGMEGMSRYDPTQPLENFLSVHISNRLKNFKRDNYVRPEPKGSEEEKEEWEKKYGAKRNLMEPLPLEGVRNETESNMWTKIDFLNEIQAQDIFTLIDIHLPVHLRADFLRMKQGILIPKPRRQKVEAVILTILEQNGYETW